MSHQEIEKFIESGHKDVIDSMNEFAKIYVLAGRGLTQLFVDYETSTAVVESCQDLQVSGAVLDLGEKIQKGHAVLTKDFAILREIIVSIQSHVFEAMGVVLDAFDHGSDEDKVSAAQKWNQTIRDVESEELGAVTDKMVKTSHAIREMVDIISPVRAVYGNESSLSAEIHRLANNMDAVPETAEVINRQVVNNIGYITEDIGLIKIPSDEA